MFSIPNSGWSDLQICVAVLGALVALALFLILFRRDRGPGTPPPGSDSSPSYALRPALLTPAEINLIESLGQSIPSHLRLHTKVRLADVFMVRHEVSGKEQRHRFLQISSKHVDFLLVKATDYTPVCGIELDDSSHDRAERIERDILVNRVFAESGIPLLRIKAARTYNSAQLAADIAALTS